MAPNSNLDLPLEPPVYSQLQDDNSKLQQQNKFLEDVIEVLSVRNRHYLTTIKRYRSHEKVLRSKIDRMVRVSRDLMESQERSCGKFQEMSDETEKDWDQFCQKKRTEIGPSARDPWDYWKNLKIRIMTKQYQDLVFNEDSDKVVTGS